MTPTEPCCATHPDVPSTGTCERCGAFVCPRCLSRLVGLTNLCASCVARQAAELPALEGRAKWTVGALALSGASNLVFFAGEVLTRGETEGLAIILFGFYALVMFAVFISTIVLFCRWFHLAVRHANAQAISVGATPAGAVGSWFIPFVNLVRPFEYTRALLTGVNGRSEYVTPWQSLWIVSNLASNVSSKLENDWVSLIAVALEVASAVYAIRLVREVTRALGDGPRS
jgi:hypothetical protein